MKDSKTKVQFKDDNYITSDHEKFIMIKMKKKEDVETHLQNVMQLKYHIKKQDKKVSNIVYNDILLNNVSETYKTTVRILEASNKLTLNEIINAILKKYRKIEKENAEKLKMMMLTNSQNQQNNQNEKFKKNVKSLTKCSHCNK